MRKRIFLCGGVILSLVIVAASAWAESSPLSLLPDAAGKAVQDPVITREQIIDLIKEQGQRKDVPYYFEGLSYEPANLDADDALEIAAKIDGGVHIGQFFILDQDSKGEYQLITERDWKVEEWDLTRFTPVEDQDGFRNVFRLVSRDGGTGVSVFTVHLCYLDQGSFIEAWQGTIQDRFLFQNNYFQKIGGYQFDIDSGYRRLYAWETTVQYQVAEDGVTPQGETKMETTTKVYNFNGTVFSETAADNAGLGPAIILAEEREVIPQDLIVTKTVSDYAHGQHIVWVEGRFRHAAGELYLTFLDAQGRQLQSGGISPSDEVKPLDGEWSAFSHKFIEDTGKVVDTDKLTIVFHLQKAGYNQKGLLEVPARKPAGIFTAGPAETEELSTTDEHREKKNWEVVSRTRRVEGTILKLAVSGDELKSVALKVTRNIQLPNDPVDSYYKEGDILDIVFNENLANAGWLKDRLKQGARIVITLAQYAVPPEGEVVLGAYLGEGTYYVENGKYYDTEGKEIEP